MIMGIDRKSSIEAEPRTLNFDQIQHARDAAIYVMSTRTVEEAMRIFTEGLQPVAKIPMENEDTVMESINDYCTNDNSRPSELSFKDIVSAPF